MQQHPAVPASPSFSMASLLVVNPLLPSSIKDALRSGRRECAAFLLVRDLGLDPADASELVR